MICLLESGVISASVGRTVRRATDEIGESGDEARHLSHVPRILVPKFSQSFALLDARQANVHEHENREHRERQQGRPLQQEPKHYGNESEILRMPDARIDARGCELVLLLCIIERLPPNRDKDETAANEDVA